MRNISFALTTAQVRAKTKTVTRRTGWAWLNVGTLLQPVVKGQGIPKGGHVEKIGGPIRVVKVERVTLAGPTLTFADVAREGFAGMGPSDFVEMFCRHNGCEPHHLVTRIEFEYVESGS